MPPACVSAVTSIVAFPTASGEILSVLSLTSAVATNGRDEAALKVSGPLLVAGGSTNCVRSQVDAAAPATSSVLGSSWVITGAAGVASPVSPISSGLATLPALWLIATVPVKSLAWSGVKVTSTACVAPGARVKAPAPPVISNASSPALRLTSPSRAAPPVFSIVRVSATDSPAVGPPKSIVSGFTAITGANPSPVSAISTGLSASSARIVADCYGACEAARLRPARRSPQPLATRARGEGETSLPLSDLKREPPRRSDVTSPSSGASPVFSIVRVSVALRSRLRRVLRSRCAAGSTATAGTARPSSPIDQSTTSTDALPCTIARRLYTYYRHASCEAPVTRSRRKGPPRPACAS